jgi:hypothetical protein
VAARVVPDCCTLFKSKTFDSASAAESAQSLAALLRLLDRANVSDMCLTIEAAAAGSRQQVCLWIFDSLCHSTALTCLPSFLSGGMLPDLTAVRLHLAWLSIYNALVKAIVLISRNIPFVVKADLGSSMLPNVAGCITNIPSRYSRRKSISRA